MSAVAEPIPMAHNDSLARRNALVLAVAQALAGGNNTVIVATGGIVGAMLAPDRGLATLSITMMVLGMWAGTLPVGLMARRYGRRFALQIGSIFGVACGLISCVAVLNASFPLFLLGTFSGGLYSAACQSYRFAAADTASEAFRPKAISWVLAGGLFAALIGPQLVIFTKDLWPPYLFAATFIGQSVLALLAAAALTLVRFPRLPAAHQTSGGRPLFDIVATPRFIVAVVCGVASYGLMNLVMTSAPLAMVDCGHSITDASLGLQWHVLAMYAPSFFTGTLMARFGTERVVMAGLGLLVVSALISISGLTLWHFWIGLIVLGLGWNFSFIGATALVTRCHRPEERNKVQAFNDFCVFGIMAIGSFSSGKLMATLGWAAVNEVILPFVFIAAALLAWRMARERRAVEA